MDDIRRQLGDRYAIERELGRGGMGAVYLARDLKLDRPVALKVLPAEFASDPALRERFLRETKTAASFSHPNIVPVHSVEERDGVIAFAMGFVEGESLAQRVRRAGKLDVRSLVRLLQDIGYALAYAHGRGVVHRDIKPDNIMLERATGRALLMDFGISRGITTQVESKGLTRVGEVVGTPEYMSPEQASGDAVDGRSDIYSLGLVALFAITGAPVITADTTQKILVKQLTERPPAAASLRPDLPAALAGAIDRCVAKTPDDRFPTAESLVETIDDARLAAPEIPLPVRLFAQEAGTLGLILTFLLVMSPFVIRAMSTGDNFDFVIPLALFFAAALTRSMQTFAAARRLASAGFTPEESLRGMQGVVDEREAMRAYLRADPDTRKRRRTTLIMAAIQLPLSMLIFAGGLANRIEVGPRQWQVTTAALIMLISGLILFGVSLVLMLRSPMRAPLGERFFRLVWLGPLGRLFLKAAARRAGPAAATQPVISAANVTRARVTPRPEKATPTPPRSPAAPVDVVALEARVSALEKRINN